MAAKFFTLLARLVAAALCARLAIALWAVPNSLPVWRVALGWAFLTVFFIILDKATD